MRLRRVLVIITLGGALMSACAAPDGGDGTPTPEPSPSPDPLEAWPALTPAPPAADISYEAVFLRNAADLTAETEVVAVRPDGSERLIAWLPDPGIDFDNFLDFADSGRSLGFVSPHGLLVIARTNGASHEFRNGWHWEIVDLAAPAKAPTPITVNEYDQSSLLAVWAIWGPGERLVLAGGWSPEAMESGVTPAWDELTVVDGRTGATVQVDLGEKNCLNGQYGPVWASDGSALILDPDCGPGFLWYDYRMRVLEMVTLDGRWVAAVSGAVDRSAGYGGGLPAVDAVRRFRGDGAWLWCSQTAWRCGLTPPTLDAALPVIQPDGRREDLVGFGDTTGLADLAWDADGIGIWAATVLPSWAATVLPSLGDRVVRIERFVPGSERTTVIEFPAAAGVAGAPWATGFKGVAPDDSMLVLSISGRRLSTLVALDRGTSIDVEGFFAGWLANLEQVEEAAQH